MNFGISARLGSDGQGLALLRHRGRRVRHRLLRQAQQVRALPRRTAILNNLEYDHADIFPDLAAIETQFHHLVRTVPGIGHRQRPRAALQRVLERGCWSERETSAWRGQPGWPLQTHEDGRFDVFFEGQLQGTVVWS
jgi:UDP-N-acetylmuramate: L-alanyl-gamma-D-glutamyl-meso-diaminopimelate ligase